TCLLDNLVLMHFPEVRKNFVSLLEVTGHVERGFPRFVAVVIRLVNNTKTKFHGVYPHTVPICISTATTCPPYGSCNICKSSTDRLLSAALMVIEPGVPWSAAALIIPVASLPRVSFFRRSANHEPGAKFRRNEAAAL